MSEGEPHAHRWRLEEPSGSQVQGVCKECGETRMFTTGYWETPISKAKNRKNGFQKKQQPSGRR